jgi:peroxiredoxin
MIKNTFYIVLLLFIYSCSSKDGEFKVKGSVDIKDGDMVYRIVADSNQQPKVIDSVVVKSGSFTMIGESLSPDVNFLSLQGVNGNFPFVLESGIVKVSLYKDSLTASKAYGTVSNDDFMEYKAETKVFVSSMNAISKDLQQASLSRDSLLLEDLQEQYRDVQDQVRDYEVNFIKKNNNSYISVLILERFVISKQMNIEEAKPLFYLFTDRLKTSKSGQNLDNAINVKPDPAEVGQIAPEFEGPGPKGEIVSLKENLGKITIVDFWASWCRPCRVENPNLVRTYNKFKDKGLTIVGVSLDRNKPNWLKAIEDDGLNWSHVSNLKYWSDPIAQMYQVRAIPASFILDEDGKIIAKNLRGSALDQKVAKLLQE